MITITYGDPDGFRDVEFNNSNEALNTLLELDSTEKDIFIDHQSVEHGKITDKLVADSTHIMVQNKMIGA